MRQALIAALVIGSLAAVFVIQNISEIRAQANVQAAGSLYDILVDRLRGVIPGANTLIIGDAIWFGFKYIVLPLVALFVLNLVFGKKYALLGLIVLAALIFIRW